MNKAVDFTDDDIYRAVSDPEAFEVMNWDDILRYTSESPYLKSVDPEDAMSTVYKQYYNNLGVGDDAAEADYKKRLEAMRKAYIAWMSKQVPAPAAASQVTGVPDGDPRVDALAAMIAQRFPSITLNRARRLAYRYLASNAARQQARNRNEAAARSWLRI